MGRVFRLYVANDELQRSTTLTLPASPYEIVDMLEQVGSENADNLYFEIEERHRGDCLADVLESGITIRELNLLAWKLPEMDESREAILEGLIKMEAPKPDSHLPYIKLLQLTENTDYCHLVHEARNDSQLGRFYAENGFVEGVDDLPDRIFEMLDFEKIGREMRLVEGGVFTSGGYVVRHDELQELKSIPNLDLRKPLYTIQLEIRKAGEKNGPWLNIELPLLEGKLDEFQAKYPRGEYEYTCLDCAVPFMREYISGADAELWDINRLARRMDFAQEQGLLPKYKAILRATGCQDVELAAELGRSQVLAEYQFTPPETVSAPTAYGVKWLQEKLGKDADLVSVRNMEEMSDCLMKRYHIEEANLEDMSNMIRSTHRNQEPSFHTAVYIELIAKSEQEFSALRDSVEAELGRGKISVDRLHLCQQDGFLSVMPSGWNTFGEEFERMLPASSVANLFPFAYTGKTDPNGFYIGYDKYGSSIIVDLERRAADKSNANTLILGSSGKGKSYFLKLLLCNILESGKQVICLDPESEYEEITRRLGGAYLDLTSGRNLINVLEPRMWSSGNDSIEGDTPEAFQASTLLSQHISFLRDFFRSYKPFDDSQIDTIEIMLGRLYSKWGVGDNTDFSVLSPADYPTLSDLYDLMDAEYQRIKAEGMKKELYTPELLRSALLGLHSICKGADAKFFNGHTNIDTSRFVTFGVKDLMESGKNIKDAMLFNILSYISHALISGGNTAGVFEELHVFLSNPVAVSYIRNAMKRVRKRNSMIVLASQNLEDFLLPGVAEMTKPLFSIPAHHFLFHPGTIDKRAYMDALQLEETEYKLILECQTGCCLYKCGAERYNLVVKTPEHKLSLYGTGGGR